MDSDDLRERVARLEERMETMKADLTATLEGFRADMAKQETRMLLAVAGMIGLAATLGFGTLAFLIGLPS